MNEQQARDVILKALCDVAPEIDASSVDPEVPFQEQLDLDLVRLRRACLAAVPADRERAR